MRAYERQIPLAAFDIPKALTGNRQRMALAFAAAVFGNAEAEADRLLKRRKNSAAETVRKLLHKPGMRFVGWPEEDT